MVKDSYNYYQVLDVTAEASQQTIHQAYRQAKLTYSPENPEVYQFFSQNEVHDWVDLIEEAYAVIGHPNTRRDYDRELDTLIQQSLNLQSSASHTDSLGLDPDNPPQGYASTAVSQYKIDPKMEEFINTQDLVDGLFLKKVRSYKNIELTDFSNLTCIAIRHLYAIENNNFAVLPASVFVRGYIIQYCRVLGLNEDRVVKSFMNLLRNEP